MAEYFGNSNEREQAKETEIYITQHSAQQPQPRNSGAQNLIKFESMALPRLRDFAIFMSWL
jgi:hypothetical protein